MKTFYSGDGHESIIIKGHFQHMLLGFMHNVLRNVRKLLCEFQSLQLKELNNVRDLLKRRRVNGTPAEKFDKSSNLLVNAPEIPKNR
jgi:hypothetical protein